MTFTETNTALAMPRDLRQDHDTLREIMHRFATAMERGVDTFDTVLHRERVAFSQLFHAHVAAEETMTTVALRDGPLSAAPPIPMTVLRRDYSGHISTWTPPRIKTDWLTYRRAVLTLQGTLLRRLDWEERELHPRLLQRRPALIVSAGPSSSGPSSPAPQHTIAANWRASAPSGSRSG